MIKPYYQQNGVTLYCGDCRVILPGLEGEFSSIITDPPWPGSEGKSNPGQNYDIYPVFKKAALNFQKFSDRLIVILGCDTDPRFLMTVPEGYPYLLTCWLRRIPPSYKGNILYGADVAYIFGTPRAREYAGPTGTGILQSETYSISLRKRDKLQTHPTFRPLRTMKWLVSHYTQEGETILDPFAGSGTTLLAAKETGRMAVGVELEEKYCELTVKRLSQAVMRFGV